MSAGSCFMKKTSNVRSWSSTGDKNGQKENGYDSFKTNLTSNGVAEVPLIKNTGDEITSVIDEKWRQHEIQLNFVQQEHSTMLAKLHSEIENLQLKVAKSELNICNCAPISSDSLGENYYESMQLRSELEGMKQEMKIGNELSATKDQRINELENRIKDMEESFEIRLKQAETVKKQSADRQSLPADVKVKQIADIKPKLIDSKTKVGADVKTKVTDVKPKLTAFKSNSATTGPPKTNPLTAAASHQKPNLAPVKNLTTETTRKVAQKSTSAIMKNAPVKNSSSPKGPPPSSSGVANFSTAGAANISSSTGQASSKPISGTHGASKMIPAKKA